MKNDKVYLGLTLLFCSSALLAKDAPSLAQVMGDLTTGANILARVMWAACVVLGIALFITAFTQFQIHRSNPKLVPLANPITCLFLGLFILAIPFAGHIFDFGGEEPTAENQVQQQPTTNIDRPIQRRH